MITSWYARFLTCLLFGAATSISVWRADKREQSRSFQEKLRSRFSPYIQPWLFPLFVLLCLTVWLLHFGLSSTIDRLFPALTRIFLHISIYNGILLLLMPILRKHFSARVCASLWVLPNILYIAYNPLIMPGQPLVILHLGNHSTPLLLIWFIGFTTTLLHQVIGHLRFRRRLLRNAKQDQSIQVRQIWHDILKEGRFQERTYPVMRSGDIRSPLSIGFFPKTTCVILPVKEYTPEELHLILYHEAVHIGRQDSFRKFFMTFCACVCWFNPFAWIAIHHCSADMELSCDETVLLGKSSETRQCYAELLLKTAGDDRGFSTCLSASAKTMLYRLTHALNPKKRFLGAVAAGIAMFLLLGTCGLIAIAHSPVTAEEILKAEEPASWSNKVVYKTNDQCTEFEDTDITFLLEYISTISFYRLTGTYAYPKDTALIAFYYQKKDHASPGTISNGVVEFILKDHTLTVIDYATGGVPEVKTYYHNSAIDWSYLKSRLTAALSDHILASP